MQIGGETGFLLTTAITKNQRAAATVQYRTSEMIGPTGAVSLSVYGYSDATGQININSVNIFGLANLN